MTSQETQEMPHDRPFVAQWGILGTGWISSEFTMDLCRPLTKRNVSDVSHAVAAVGSRDKVKAEQFIAKFAPRGGVAQQSGLVQFKPAAHGAYRDVVRDPNVHIVYVGSPHIAHYQDCKLALEGGKHCLVEKPATLNAAEWRDLVRIAKEKNVFLMEGVWTRFNPTMLVVQKALFSGEIGDVRCLYADLSMDCYGKRPETSRLLAAELAGGALLDLGPYPLVWTVMLLYRHPANNRTPPAKIGSTMMLSEAGIDLATQFGISFPGIKAFANCSVNLLSATEEQNCVRVVGNKGEIIVTGLTSRPQGFVVKRLVDPSKESREFHPDEVHDLSFEGFGLYWEADAVARCLRDGLCESPDMPLVETNMTMEIFDQIRKDGGYTFVPGLEKVSL